MGSTQSSPTALEHLSKRFIRSSHPLDPDQSSLFLLHERLSQNKFILRILTTNDREDRLKIEDLICKKLALSKMINQSHCLTPIDHYLFEEERGTCNQVDKVFILFNITNSETLAHYLTRQYSKHTDNNNNNNNNSNNKFSTNFVYHGLLNLIYGVSMLQYYKHCHQNISCDTVYVTDKTFMLSDPWISVKREENLYSPEQLLEMKNQIGKQDNYLADLFTIGMIGLKILGHDDLLSLYNFANKRIDMIRLHQKIETIENGKLKSLIGKLLGSIEEREQLMKEAKKRNFDDSDIVYKTRHLSGKVSSVRKSFIRDQKPIQTLKDPTPTSIHQQYSQNYNLPPPSYQNTTKFPIYNVQNNTSSSTPSLNLPTNRVLTKQILLQENNAFKRKDNTQKIQTKFQNSSSSTFMHRNSNEVNNEQPQIIIPSKTFNFKKQLPVKYGAVNQYQRQQRQIYSQKQFSHHHQFNNNHQKYSEFNDYNKPKQQYHHQRQLSLKFNPQVNPDKNNKLSQSTTGNPYNFTSPQNISFIPNKHTVTTQKSSLSYLNHQNISSKQIQPFHISPQYRDSKSFQTDAQYQNKILSNLKQLQQKVSSAIQKSKNYSTKNSFNISPIKTTPPQNHQQQIQREQVSKIVESFIVKNSLNDEDIPKQAAVQVKNQNKQKDSIKQQLKSQKSKDEQKQFSEQSYVQIDANSDESSPSTSNNNAGKIDHVKQQMQENLENEDNVQRSNPLRINQMNNQTIPEESDEDSHAESQQGQDGGGGGAKGEFVEELYQNGGKYIGYMRNGYRNGGGIFYYRDGGYYDGKWKNNMMNGFGQLYYQSGKLAYEGLWYQDEFHGRGKVYNDSPEEFNEGYNYKNMNNTQNCWSYYEGQLSHDTKSGRGKLMLSNGQYYQGQFDKDLIHGAGSFHTKTGETIKGQWKQGLLISQQK